jgi:hypothetical protein
MRNTRTIILASLLLTTATTSLALAGRKIPWPVTVDLAAHHAWGSLASTRNSPDSTSMLGCGVHYDYVNKKNNVNCAAVDAKGNSAQCATQQPELVQIALGINGDSFLGFRWDDQGTCTDIEVVNASYLEPKQP